MSQEDIIRKNIAAYLESRKDFPDCKVLERFEGWGRCTNLIDKESDESRLFHELLMNDGLSDFVVANLYRDAQSATGTSFYTPAPTSAVIVSMCSYAYQTLNGKKAESVLDPSAGTGNFVPRMAKEVTAIEKDRMTAEILKAILAQHENISVKNMPYEGVDITQYDMIMSNIPFGDIEVSDSMLSRKMQKFCAFPMEWVTCQKKIHNYYFIKSMLKLNDGGILAFITSRGFLSSQKNKPYREEMLKRGRVVDIVRLPDNLFPTVDVGTDLIIYQRWDESKIDKFPMQPLDRLFAGGWPDSMSAELAASVHDITGMELYLPGCTEQMKKNQYGKQVYRYVFRTEKQNNKDIEIAFELRNQIDMSTNFFKSILDMLMGSSPQTEDDQDIEDAVILEDEIPEEDIPVVELPEEPHDETEHKALKQMAASFLFFFFFDEEGKLSDDEEEQDAMVVMKPVRVKPQPKEKVKEEPKAEPEPVPEKTPASRAEDALAASLNLHGYVNLYYMESCSGMDRETLKNELKGQVFLNPITGGYEERDRWLSGNIVEKCKETEQHVADYEDGEREEAEYALSSLRACRPMKIDFDDINIQLHSRWIPKELLVEFIVYLYDEELAPEDISLEYVQQTDQYVGQWVNCPNPHYSEWRVKDYDMKDMVLHAMQGTCPDIHRTEDGKSVRDEEACQMAERIISQIRDEWDEFMNRPNKEEWRKKLEAIYNDTYNCEVRPTYDGSFQTFPGLRTDNLGYELYQSQKDCIWMLKRNGGGVCYHDVGTGKTTIMCVASNEMKRLGLARKPMIIGLKANIAQIAETYRKAYPDAKVLVPCNADFKDGEVFDRIKNEDWDVIIMTHEQFERIPAAEQTEIRLLQEEVDGLDDALQNITQSAWRNRILKGLQKRRDKMRSKLLELQEEIRSRQTAHIDFSELGIDHIFVDESQQFKNLAFATRNERVAGIGNPEGSKRAWKLLTAIRDIQYRTGRDLGATFLSGTIVSNSLAELYIIFKYLRPMALAKQNIHSFDAWAALFTEKKTDYEVNVVGKIQSKERFAAYVNLPELGQFFRQITDYRSAEMCGIDAPEMVQHFESAPPTQQQEIMLHRMLDFVNGGNWDALGIDRERPVNLDKALMLCATNIARQISLDPRMLDNCKTFGDEAGCKIRRCAENIMKMYVKHNEHKGTQFVFNDISTLDSSKWNMQQELADVLVREYGFPKNEIAFINNASSDKARMAIFEKMNRGEIRLLMGSTTKLGTGVNAQQRAVAIHHLDIPWRPSDMEQRNGRAIRKGNEVKLWADNKVEVFIYATERTLDSYKFCLLKNKQNFINQLNSGTLGLRRIDDSVLQDGDQAMSYAEFLSIISGNQDLLKKAKLDAKIMAIERQRNAFKRQKNQAVEKIAQYESDNKRDMAWIAKAQIDLRESTLTDGILPVVNGKNPKDLTEAGKWLCDIGERNRKEEYTVVGSAGNFKIAVKLDKKQYENEVPRTGFYLIGPSGQYYRGVQGTCITGNITRVLGLKEAGNFPFNTLGFIANDIESKKASIAKHLDEIPSLQVLTEREWDGKEELDALYAELEEVKRRIDGKESSQAA